MQNDRYIAAVDQGTTGTKCLIFDIKGKVISKAYKRHRQILPKEGWVEHDPLEILSSVKFVLNSAIHSANLGARDITAVGVSNQRETTVLWDKKTGMPLSNAIVWQDLRTQDIIKKIKDNYSEKEIEQKTGLKLSTYFSASKIKWLIDNSDKIKRLLAEKRVLAGNIDSWLIWKLTNEKKHLTDYTNASRTLLMNLRTKEWDPDMLEIFKIPKDILPEIKPSINNEAFGTINYGNFKGVRITGVLGDQQAALLGERGTHDSDVKVTYGTGSFILQNTGRKIKRQKGLLTTCAYGTSKNDCNYALEGSVPLSGEIFDWLEELGIMKSFSEIKDAITADLDTNLFLVPAFSGLFSPYWDQSARGIIIGLTRKSNKLALIKAAAYSICMQVVDIIKRMENFNDKINVDGGVASNDYIMQLQANLLGKKIYRSDLVEESAFGAALSAGISSGVWNFNSIQNLNKSGRYFYPKVDSKTYNTIYSKWIDAVKRSRGWSKSFKYNKN
ncbi:MAG: glycerol kinase [Candidatus Parvarchaeum sp.]|nr:glycerol kinase GlpK [Candidatus Parvarchaeota archaeon]MCW1295351.1 glycerol kinase GlpK [Candidatus Parvarchaeum tengchongense]MCW1299065.1 glycerol kinase GlpK [Candidatus Parvarchaeum tengchongense]